MVWALCVGDERWSDLLMFWTSSPQDFLMGWIWDVRIREIKKDSKF